MFVRILGCGGSTGVPALGGADGAGDWGACDPAEARNRRRRACIVVGAPGGNILVDTGPDLREQMLTSGVGRIDAVLFTHAHADHITGLDDVRQLNRVIDAPLPGVALPETAAELRRRFDYAFRPWEPPGFYRPVIEMNEVSPGQTIELCGARLHVFEQDHQVMRSMGFRIGDFAYCTDVVRFPAASFAALGGLDTWVVGCFQRAPHFTHAHVDLVLEWRARLRPRRVVLTHMGIDLDWAWMRAHLPADVEPGFDGMTIELAD